MTLHDPSSAHWPSSNEPNTWPPGWEQLVSRRCSASRLSLNRRGQGQLCGLSTGQRLESIPPPQVGSPESLFDLRCVELFSEWKDGDNVLITSPLIDSFSGNDWAEVHHREERHWEKILQSYNVVVGWFRVFFHVMIGFNVVDFLMRHSKRSSASFVSKTPRNVGAVAQVPLPKTDSQIKIGFK